VAALKAKLAIAVKSAEVSSFLRGFKSKNIGVCSDAWEPQRFARE
jgi:hypothetical protein